MFGENNRPAPATSAPPDNPLAVLATLPFSRVADARLFAGNSIRLLRDGTENYPAWLAAIAQAEHTVLLENYLLREDAIGQAFAEALAAAVRRGVTCRVLYDWLGCRSKTSREFWAALRAGGVEVRGYNAPQLGNPLRVVSRDHRKVLCIDSRIGFTGGLCIAQDWAGSPERGIPPWRDTAIEIRGPAVACLAQAFADSWQTQGAPLPPEELPPPERIAAAGDIELSIIAGKPDSMGLYRLEQLVAEIAQQSLWLSDAYFVATTGYVRALTGAAQAGVDVRILVPRSGNLRLVQAISRAAYRPLLGAGVRVFEWNGPMMHAKTAVVDGCWSRVGSSNSNLASWITNRELDVTIYDAAFAGQMVAMFESDLENATEVVLESGRLRSFRATPPGRTGGREDRQRSASRLLAGAVGFGSAIGASVARHRALGASELRGVSVAGLALIVLALAAFCFPPLIAYPVAIAAAWFGIALVVHARKPRDAATRGR